MRVCVYSHHDDPIVASLNDDTVKISVAELLNQVSIFDTIDDGEVRTEWILTNQNKITNSQDTLLINRVHYLDPSLFDDFQEEDKHFSESEFRAYLSFALNAFPNKIGKPGPYGLSYPSCNLMEQWFRVARADAFICTPRYFYGKRKSAPAFFEVGGIVKNPYDGHCWKITQSMSECGADEIIFVHEKPSGTPVIVNHCYGDFEVPDSYKLSPELKNKLIGHSEIIATALESSFSQILFFISESTITFASLQNNISHQPNDYQNRFKESLANL